MAKVKTTGTELYYADAATTVVKIAAVTAISGLGGPADQIDTTDFDDTDRTFLRGYGNPGQVTVNFILDPSETSQSGLMALKDAGTVSSWGIYTSQSATAPTAVGSVMQTVVDRSSFIFDAYISDVTFDFASNEVIRGTLTLQRSGTVSYDPV